MSESNEPKVTMKDTKAKILDAYHEVLERLQEADLASMKPEERIKKEKDKQTINSANKNLDALAGFAMSVTESIADYDNICKAVDIKKAELQNLFDIEVQALSLAALVDSHEEIKRKLELDMKERKEVLENELDKLVITIDETEDNESIRRKRSESEFNYEFERNKQKKIDELEDELTRMKKVVAENIEEQNKMLQNKRENLDEREIELEKKADEFEALKIRVDGIPEEIAEAVKAAVGKEKGILTSRLESEKKYFERDIKAEVEMANSKVKSLSEDNQNLRNELVEVKGKLDAAYREIRDMAIKTVEGANNTKTFNDLKGYLSENKSSK